MTSKSPPCAYCGKPVIEFVEASYGGTGNHFDCHTKAVQELVANHEEMQRIAHVVEWYTWLGQSRDEAIKRVAQERKLIKMSKPNGVKA
jgi:hypothetical protein